MNKRMESAAPNIQRTYCPCSCHFSDIPRAWSWLYTPTVATSGHACRETRTVLATYRFFHLSGMSYCWAGASQGFDGNHGTEQFPSAMVMGAIRLLSGAVGQWRLWRAPRVGSSPQCDLQCDPQCDLPVASGSSVGYHSVEFASSLWELSQMGWQVRPGHREALPLPSLWKTGLCLWGETWLFMWNYSQRWYLPPYMKISVSILPRSTGPFSF